MIPDQRLLGNGLHLSVNVQSELDLSAVKRLAGAAAESQGFDQSNRDRVRLVASEMASNLVRHSTQGRIFVRVFACGDLGGVELVSSDHGPGVPVTDTRGASHDGTVHANPEDLRAIVAASDLFDVYGAPGRGTVVVSRLWGAKPAVAGEGRFLVGSMMEPIVGEEVSGDAWAVEQSDSRVVALVVDGLGHGVDAAAASAAAVKAFRLWHEEPVEDIVGHIHRALYGTRGAAVAVAEIDPGAGRARFCGIGNIAVRLITDADTKLISQFGIAGYQAPKIRAYDQAWEDGALLVMHSDGLSPGWDLRGYSGLLSHHPQLAAAMVMRDAARANDDALVLALRQAPETIGVTTVQTR